MIVLKIAGRILLFFVVLTILGQVPFEGRSLENRYHRVVNSQRFQHIYWTTLRPVTWTSEKVEALIAQARQKTRNPSAR